MDIHMSVPTMLALVYVYSSKQKFQSETKTSKLSLSLECTIPAVNIQRALLFINLLEHYFKLFCILDIVLVQTSVSLKDMLILLFRLSTIILVSSSMSLLVLLC